MLIDALRRPILAPILRKRHVCLMITGAAILQLSLVILSMPAWRSPIHAVLGIPDPGCGLSRALVALLRADWQTALRLHAFSPLFAVTLGLIAIAGIVPQGLHDKMVSLVEILEWNTGMTAILFIALVIYWLARLVFFHEVFLRLVGS